VRHHAPAAAGAVFVPLIVLMFLFSARVGALVPRLGDRPLLCLGPRWPGLDLPCSPGLTACTGTSCQCCPRVLILGCGMTLCVAPLTYAMMSSVAWSGGLAVLLLLPTFFPFAGRGKPTSWSLRLLGRDKLESGMPG
jgi:hypothetical protein